MCKVLNHVIITLYVLSPAHPQMVPPLDIFLSRLFDVATTEIGNIASSFNFHEVSSQDIAFILHLPDNETITFNPKNHSFIDPSKPTKIMIHGWQASGTDGPNSDMAQKYHKNGNYNVIAIDWSEHAKKVYMHSSSSTKEIGNLIGDFILDLTKKNAGLLGNIHLIAHSLGGHVAGFAGQRVFEKSGKKIGRITGLDVAAPLFEVPRRRSDDFKLSPDDADFVDVIHTNAGFLGVSDAIGTADFYVANGGPLQPGCFDPLNIFESIGCSHFKSFEYFLDSVGGKKYEALSCRNSIEYHILACNNNEKVIMGEYVPKTAKGNYYLESESPLPYSKLLENPFGIKVNAPRFRLPFIN